MDGFSPLNVLRKARSNHEWKRWRQITAFFWVELRALALAVLVVQVCCCACGASVLVLCLRCKCAAENAVTCKFCTVFVSIASLQRLAMPILSTSAAASKSRDVTLQLAACKDTSQQTRNAHAAV